ncbi:hypothetical protein QAD02_023108 [Eretmocerus hayati]|uniref:Uncharacterized protein n=1 Tax=Eretmocerus hayati TaxID=131215 RepID=A0ACC2PVJ2_9HYME|nr:hypothetical protein QAD02_023108 [Eretmocerus hayati]
MLIGMQRIMDVADVRKANLCPLQKEANVRDVDQIEALHNGNTGAEHVQENENVDEQQNVNRVVLNEQPEVDDDINVRNGDDKLNRDVVRDERVVEADGNNVCQRQPLVNVPHPIITSFNALESYLNSKAPHKTLISIKHGGVGLYFNFQVTDGISMIRGDVFGDPCRRIHGLLRVYQIYGIPGFKVNSVNPRYGSGFGIVLGQGTLIHQRNDVQFQFVELQYDFKDVGAILRISNGTFIDSLGKIKSYGLIQTCMRGTEIVEFRNVELTDERKFQVSALLQFSGIKFLSLATH